MNTKQATTLSPNTGVQVNGSGTVETVNDEGTGGTLKIVMLNGQVSLQATFIIYRVADGIKVSEKQNVGFEVLVGDTEMPYQTLESEATITKVL